MTDTAYYYPAPYWGLRDSGWIKSLLLFFDDVAILLPDYMYGRHIDADPTLAEPLEDRGLLRVIEPNDWVDKEIADKLAEVVVELLTNGAFNDLPKVEYFAELSQSRIGYGADVKLAGFFGRRASRERTFAPERGWSFNPSPSRRAHHYPCRARTTLPCRREKAWNDDSPGNEHARSRHGLGENAVSGVDAITR